MKRTIRYLLWLCIAFAALPARAETNRLCISFSEDIPPPLTLPYAKLERITLDGDIVGNAVEKYRISPRADEQWELQIGVCDHPDCALLFKERNGAAGGIACDYAGAPGKGTGEKYDRASRTVKSFLDEIGLTDYEYPFYFCNDAYHAFYGSPFHPITAEEYRAANPDYAQAKWERAGGSPVLVVARLKTGALPFAASISWTAHTDASGNGNPTPSAFFLVSESGELCEAYIRNPVRVVRERESGEAILPWQAVLESNRKSIENAFLSGESMDDQMILRYVELVLATDERNITFPAWNFVFERYAGPASFQKNCGDLPESCRVTQLGLLYHAFTGAEVWRKP